MRETKRRWIITNLLINPFPTEEMGGDLDLALRDKSPNTNHMLDDRS